MENGSERVVPMRLFANWETDRTSTSAVQRMFTMALSRLIFNSLEDQQYSFVITVKLAGNKRTLRSNEIQVTTNGGKLDIPLSISFIIQYPHFLKRKSNVLQILLQRRKRYKNRQMPGYKTLAVGSVSLSEVLQNGNLKDITLFDPDSEKEERPVNCNLSPLGRILVSSCQSVALELENEVNVQRLKEKEIESEEEEGSSSDAQYSENDQEVASDSGRKQRLKMRNSRERKLAQRKNLKQKFVSLLKKFKVPEEDVVGSSSRVENGASTAKQLEELFEELENLSDSGPEMVGDNLSIISNPRPGLMPYFAATSREVLPAIKDGQSDESDEDWSSELEAAAESMARTEKSGSGPGVSNVRVDTSRGDGWAAEGSSSGGARSAGLAEQTFPSNGARSGHQLATSLPTRVEFLSTTPPSATVVKNVTPTKSGPSSAREPALSLTPASTLPKLGDITPSISSASAARNDNISAGTGITYLPGSAACESNLTDVSAIDAKLQYGKYRMPTTDKVSPRTATFSDRLAAIFRDGEPWSSSGRLCVCSLANLPILGSFGSSFCVLDCASFTECRMLISTIVNKIQKFCNSSSATPPCTTLFVIGYEKLINNVLRAYVESLQTKSADWINFLRFCVIPPPWSSLGRLIGLCQGYQCSLRELFERPASELVTADLKIIEDKLHTYASGSVYRLPIGEAMLQLHKKSVNDDNESQIFVPFLAEVKIGQYEEDAEVLPVSRLQEEIQNSPSSAAASPSHISPPSSPHSAQKSFDSQELQIEYWTPSSQVTEAGTSGNPSGSAGMSQPSSGSGKRDTQFTKTSLRSVFRSFSILRKQSSEHLSLHFIKEKKKEKMLQKLGMKKGQKSETESPITTQCVNNVTRLICSGKQHPLTVCIDGNSWSGVRFFQASMQWQTHVKHFPICVPPNEHSCRA